MNRRDLLVELGCEELPARALVGQARSMRDGLVGQLAEAGLVEGPDRARWLTTPRRLAVIVREVADRQPDRLLERRGPAESAAFDGDGKPTRAALGFAKSVGLEVDQLGRLENGQGRWLYAEIEQPGQALADLLQGVLEKVVRQMAGARSMRWADRSDRFLRPVRWLVALHGDDIVDLSLFGLRAGRTTRGHRIHAPGGHEITAPADYESVLENACVLADFDRRRERIEVQLRERAAEAGLALKDDPELVHEVTGLVEWPVAVVGAFDEAFLDVPPEALVSSMREHQKSFPLFAAGERLANRFVAVANLESRDPPVMIHGFERVIRPRLADAKFFYEVDRRKPLHARFERLSEMLFQERLGSLADKSNRLMVLAADLAPAFGADPGACRRAAELSKCDLLTEMVGEFPELQGTMGRYYALADGEPEAVAAAIETHYLPRQAGDELPPDPVGQALAVADRLDTLLGVFAAGKKPKAGKDPFGLRRAALAVIRILEHTGCALGLDELLKRTAAVVDRQVPVDEKVLDELRGFLEERLRSLLSEHGIETNTIHATMHVSEAQNTASVSGTVRRAEAVQRFADDPKVESLIVANKRAANLLEQSGRDDYGEVDRCLLQIDAEKTLFDEVVVLEKRTGEHLANHDYPAVLKELAGLKPVVDRFFDDVMVMVDDERLQANRLALLWRLRRLFLRIADVARLGRA